METVLVTGGGGYVGSVLVEKLARSGYAVRVLDSMWYTDVGLRESLAKGNITCIQGDIREGRVRGQSLRSVDHIVHLAGIANDPSGELDPQLTREVNLEILEPFLEEAAELGVATFINFSTFGVYGKKDNVNITEDEPLLPLKEYSACKAKGEEVVRAHNSDNFTTISLRCSTVCGWSPRMRFDLIVNTLTGFGIVEKRLEVWGGEQKRPQIHIDDITDYVLRILNMPKDRIGGKVYNAGGQNLTISEIAEAIRRLLPFQVEVRTCPARDDERTYHVSSEKIKVELGLEPKKTVDDAIRDIFQAYERKLWTDPGDALYHNIKRMKQLKLG